MVQKNGLKGCLALRRIQVKEVESECTCGSQGVCFKYLKAVQIAAGSVLAMVKLQLIPTQCAWWKVFF